MAGGGGGGGLTATGGAAGPATSGAQSSVSGLTFGSVNNNGGPSLTTWLIIGAAVALFLLYGRRKK